MASETIRPAEAPARRTTHVRRERILRDIAAADPPILAVVAPAGWGKTTLLHEWAAARDGGMAFLTLGRRLGDADALLHALARECARATGTPLHGWLERAEPDGRPAAARLQSLLDRSPAPAGIALDDVHTLPDDAPAQDLLDALVERARDARIRLALASRRPPPCVRPRDVVHGTALRLDPGVLAMDSDEIAAFFHGTPIDGDREALRRVADHTRGWPAGLRILRHRSTRAADGDSGPATGEDALAAYFDEEILAPLDEALRDALGDLALLECIDSAACDAIGATHAFTHAERLADEGLFVTRGDDGLRLHPMLREHLRARTATRAPARVVDRVGRLARWHLAHGRTREALEHALDACAASDGEDAAQLAAECLEAAAPTLIEIGRNDVVRRAADAIPASAVCTRPLLSGLLQWLNGRFDDAPDTVPDDPAGRCMHHLLHAGRALREGRFDALATAALEARATVPGDDAFLRNMIVSVLQAGFRFGGDPRVGAAAVEEAMKLAEDVRRPAAAVQAGAMLGILLIMHGRLYAAEDALRRALAVADARLDPAAPARGLAHQFLGYVLYEWDRLEEAAAELERAHAIAAPLTHRGILTGTLRVLAVVRIRLGDHSGAEAAMDELSSLMDRPETEPRNREWLDGVRAAYAVAAAHVEPLQGWIARRGYRAEAIASLPAVALHARLQEYTTFAEALLLLGRSEDAASVATVLREAARGANRRGFQVAAGATLAAAAESAGRRIEADEALAEALAVAAPEGMVRTLADSPGPLAGVLARTRPNGVPLRFLEAVRRAAGDGAAPAGLTDRERDVLVLLAGGRSNKALARSLGVSVSTVKTHLHHAFRKLGARSRTHALARARELGVFDDTLSLPDTESAPRTAG